MTLEVVVIAAIRIAGSLPVLRWPLLGGLLAILVDLSDLLLRDVLDLGGVPDYQGLDKWLDQVYLGCLPRGRAALGGSGADGRDRALRSSGWSASWPSS